jgi:hypothetical protein
MSESLRLDVMDERTNDFAFDIVRSWRCRELSEHPSGAAQEICLLRVVPNAARNVVLM